jgi:hypothetical protein
VSAYRLRHGGSVVYRHEYSAGVAAADPSGASINCTSSVEVRRDTGVILVRAISRFTLKNVMVQAEVEQDGAVIFQREWKKTREAST